MLLDKKRLFSVTAGLLLCAAAGCSDGVQTANGELEVVSDVDAIAQNTSFSAKESLAASESVYETFTVEDATVHMVSVAANTPVALHSVPELMPLEAFAQQFPGEYLLNAGFFDPQNGLTTSHIVQQGDITGNPQANARLMGNPALQRYLPQILNRSAFRTYTCESSPVTRYDIAPHDQATPDDCALVDAVGAGPQLLPEDRSVQEAFVDYDEDGQLIRDAIGTQQPNARSAIGIHADGTVRLFMVERNGQSAGMSLPELAEFAAQQGVVKLLNLDGGSSSALAVTQPNGNRVIHYGRIDEVGDPIVRPIKSVILVGPAE